MSRDEMESRLQREVVEAVVAGTSLSTIEQTIIDRSSLDEEQRAVLWLLAEALRDQPHPRASPPPIAVGTFS